MAALTPDLSPHAAKTGVKKPAALLEPAKIR
jgi:hypothetical protein